jgi:antitoxin (DNA-binding transcriptional repressor) of toxin-antitoxin stability system
MAMARYAGEHRGHRLVEVRSPRGSTTYRLPERYAAFQISDCIRTLSSEGWSRAEISKETGILYQHVRNVLESSDRGPATGSQSTKSTGEAPSPGTDATAIEESAVGSAIAFGTLVARVEQGQEITVMRRGEAVARLVTARSAHDTDAIEAAMRRIGERRKSLSLEGLENRDLIDAGRKY